MKFLENNSLADLEMKLSGLEIGDYLLAAKLEAYSCKLAGVDKKLTKSLERRFSEELAKSPDSSQYLDRSPVGPLSDSTSRKTLFNLICTLNAAYSDYDFSGLTLDTLTRERSVEHVVRRVDSSLEPAYKLMGQGLRTALWTATEEVISPYECEIYSYISDGEESPFGIESQVWSTHLFFYNKRQKKVLLMELTAYNRLALEEKEDELDMEMELEDDNLGSRVSMMAY